NGLMAFLNVDRDTASRLGLSLSNIDTALYSAFGQRQVSTMYTQLNQYHVVMEVAPEYWQNPQTLHDIYVQATPPAAGVRASTASNGGVLTAMANAPTTATAASASSLVASSPTPSLSSGAGGTPTVGLSSPAGTASIAGSSSSASSSSSGASSGGNGTPAAV